MRTLSATPPVWIILGSVLVVVALSVLLPLLVRTGRRPPDSEWKAGVFYSNPDDRSILVPKRFGIGYTLNFGNPWAWVVLVFILVMVALPFVLTRVMVRPFLK